jgi:hypothetical protein
MTTRNESPLELLAKKAVRRFTPPLYQEKCREGLSERDYVSARLVNISNALDLGTDTEDTRRIIEIFLALDPGATPYDDSAKKALFAELREVATFIPMGLYNYSATYAVEPTSQFLKLNELTRADTARGNESVWSYRRRLELSLRYQQLFLETMLSYTKPSSKTAWHSKAREALNDPFSSTALGLNKWSAKGPLNTRLNDLKAAVAELAVKRSLAGALRDGFLAASIEDVVERLDKLVEPNERTKSWRDLFEFHGFVLVREIEEQLLEFESGRRCWVVSDAHLGLAGGNDGAFSDLLGACEKGDRLILLGDILDFWIHLEHTSDLEEAVAAEWRLLYKRLTDLRARGVSVTYIPGNHDMFVFVLEGVGHLDWCSSLVSRCPSLARLHEVLADYPLSSVCEIHYPFVKLEFNGVSTLFTHGHAHELQWHFLTGSPYEDGMILAFVQTTATVMAYRFARQLRGVFNLALNAPTEWVRHTTDVAMAITNRHLSTYASQNVRLDTRQNRAKFVESLVKEFERLTASPDRNEVRAIDAARAFDQLEKWSAAPVAEIREETSRYLKKNPTGLNFRIWALTEFQAALSTLPFSRIGAFDQFLCGHYHMPRDQFPDYDNGCLLRPGPTACVMVTKDGKIVRPIGVFG